MAPELPAAKGCYVAQHRIINLKYHKIFFFGNWIAQFSSVAFYMTMSCHNVKRLDMPQKAWEATQEEENVNSEIWMSRGSITYWSFTLNNNYKVFNTGNWTWFPKSLLFKVNQIEEVKENLGLWSRKNLDLNPDTANCCPTSIFPFMKTGLKKYILKDYFED